MKALRNLLTFVFVLALAATCQSGLSQAPANVAKGNTARVPVLLELFTSEGCSTCPPADALLAKLDETQPVAGAEIIGLEEHVDYWDQQGWNDPFSSSQWTERQQAYAPGLRDHGVYTPELIVNGSVGFIGSREGDAYRSIAVAVTQPHTEISLSLSPSEKHDHARLKIEVGKLQGAQPGDGAEVWVAIAESALHSKVTGGENSGHELHHAPVVRWLHKAGSVNANASPSFTGESDLKLESAWKRNNLRVVAFVQEKRNRHILGAASVRLEP